MSSAVVRKFLDSTSRILEATDLRGQEEVSPIFFIASLFIIALTSFTTSFLVVFFTLIASAALVATRTSRVHAREFFLVLVYVFLFSLIALLPFLVEGLVSLYFFYVIRAISATSFLLVMTAISGWRGLSDFVRMLKLPDVVLVLMMYVKIISVLLRDASKILLSREARLISNVGFKNLRTHASVIGDLLIRGSERGKRAFLAVEARTFDKVSEERDSRKVFKLSRLDVVVSLIAFIEILTHLVGEVFW